jgi:hypothetical protein
MSKTRLNCLITLCVLIAEVAAHAQGASPSPAPQEGWDVAVYPIFAWMPLGIGIEAEIPPFEGVGGEIGNIVDSRFDGAFFGGLAASNGTWRIEADGIWAAFGGDRIERPHLVADIDLIYGHAKVGRRVSPDLYLTAGVRRLALKYDVTLGDLPQFSRTPGIWNPLVGIGWHRRGPTVEWHTSFEGGGFGVGAEVDLAGTVRMDWKPVRHFGITGGYNMLYLKVTDTVFRRSVILKQSVHGPIVGIGFYF